EGLNIPSSPMLEMMRDKIVSNLRVYLKPGTQTVGAKCTLRLWGTDRGGNPFEGLSREDFLAGKPATVTIIQGE
ncbi:MAG: hypothetical protein Q8O00_05890, partial [Holophaga sp.]|nr:hypothetical protein [Holophaga sp.]